MPTEKGRFSSSEVPIDTRTHAKPNRHIMVKKKNNKYMVGSLARS
jgi:hypothetical protein